MDYKAWEAQSVLLAMESGVSVTLGDLVLEFVRNHSKGFSKDDLMHELCMRTGVDRDSLSGAVNSELQKLLRTKVLIHGSSHGYYRAYS